MQGLLGYPISPQSPVFSDFQDFTKSPPSDHLLSIFESLNSVKLQNLSLGQITVQLCEVLLPTPAHITPVAVLNSGSFQSIQTGLRPFGCIILEET